MPALPVENELLKDGARTVIHFEISQYKTRRLCGRPHRVAPTFSGIDRRVFVMELILISCWFCKVLPGRLTVFRSEADCVEGRVGVKTEFCPLVSGILSWCVLKFVPICPAFVPLWPGCQGEQLRTGAGCSSEARVKIDGDSGVVETVVLDIPVCVDVPRARARKGTAYASAGGEQGESVQLGVREVQWCIDNDKKEVSCSDRVVIGWTTYS